MMPPPPYMMPPGAMPPGMVAPHMALGPVPNGGMGHPMGPHYAPLGQPEHHPGMEMPLGELMSALQCSTPSCSPCLLGQQSLSRHNSGLYAHWWIRHATC